MKLVGPVLLALCLSSCVGIDFGSTKSKGGSSTTTDTSDAAAPVQGVECLNEATTGATICTGISSCESTFVDHDLYPHCGFRVQGTILDLECACDGWLCPIGVASTCAQAASLLKVQSEWAVCNQVNEGRCTKGTSTAPARTCDEDCRIKCVTNECETRCGC